ncbi:hypothetical protein [Streptomyces sp. RKAG290]|uniref:hypothetical protein n=1 Tax=Streptomyces sp. RKAG290 TaxID=2888348 RepID=UPI0020348AAE|nr:hypothetical protein [Streptomyces sp. RKAG290]MCM2414525.1 hypothetical protein [Streptomyces sp. RKAG290]
MRQVPTRWTVPLLTTAALLAAATACTDQQKTPAPVPSSAVIGHWAGDCGATLDIIDGGHFAFAGFPSGEGAHDERRLTGNGRWYLYRGGKDALPPSLDLKHDKVLLSLFYTRSSDGAVTAMHFDEEDRTCTFRQRKQEAPGR